MVSKSIEFTVPTRDMEMPRDGTPLTRTFLIDDAGAWDVVTISPRAGTDLVTVIGSLVDGVLVAEFPAAAIGGRWALRLAGQERMAGVVRVRPDRWTDADDEPFTFTLVEGGEPIEVTVLGGGGGSSVTVSDEAPDDPSEGDQWFDATDGSMYLWVGDPGAWVETNPAAPVQSVNGETGAVELTADDVGVDSAPWGGTADKVQGALGEITTGFGAVLDGLATDLAALTRVPGLGPWYQALQDRADTIADGVPVDVVLFGDSLTSYPSPLFCWPSKAAAGINRAWTTRPSPDQPFHCAGAVASVGMEGTDGGTLETAAVGRDGRSLTNGQTIVASIGSTATGVGIVYQERSGGGTLTVRHTDGSGAVLATIDTDGTTTRSRVRWITGPIDFTGFERRIHIASTGNTLIEAIQPTTPGQVTRWWNCSAFGTKASNPTAQPLVGLSLLSALVDDPAANPKLVILGYGTNQVDAAEYTTQMSALIAAAQDRAPDAQIVAWLPHRGPTWTDDRWAEIRAAAPSLGVPILDAATPAPLSNDGTHPIAPDRAMSRSLGGRLSGNALAYLMADLETAAGDVQARNATGDRTLSLIAERVGLSFLRFQAPGSDMALAFGPDGVTVASPIGALTGTPDGLLTAGTLRLPPMASLPAGPNAAGTIANHNGTLKICTTAGSPGTWTVIGAQT